MACASCSVVALPSLQPQALGGQHADLTVLLPSLFATQLAQRQSQRKARPLRLRRDGHCQHRARAVIENIVVDDESRVGALLLIATIWVKLSAPDFAPKNAGHADASCGLGLAPFSRTV